MAFIHVIIPVYNAEAYLRRTVASVLDQPCRQIDIVLVNDGSTDGSAAVCDELAAGEPRIRVIHQKNAGVSAARNAGIEAVLDSAAEEGYIAFLDADDLWCPDVFTAEGVAALRSDAPDVMGFSMYGCDAAAQRYCILSQYQTGVREFQRKYQTDFLWANGSFAAHLYHIRLFRENPVRFLEECRQNEDVIFSAAILFCSRRIRFSDRFLYIYRRNRGSVTSRNRYRPENASHIPDAWYAAAGLADRFADAPEEMKSRWRYFCTSTAAIRCLEMIRELAAAGYDHSAIRECFASKPYFRDIGKLRVSELAPWQQPDLVRYNESPEGFCGELRRRSRLRNPLRGLMRRCGLMDLLDRRQYTLTKEDILTDGERCFL